MSAASPVTDDTFDQDVLASAKPVVVDFWAPWCAPCRQVAPILDEISEQHGDKISIVTMNTDENSKVPARYGITSLPTIAVYSGGELVKTIVGAKPKPMMLRELAEWIA